MPWRTNLSACSSHQCKYKLTVNTLGKDEFVFELQAWELDVYYTCDCKRGGAFIFVNTYAFCTKLLSPDGIGFVLMLHCSQRYIICILTI